MCLENVMFIGYIKMYTRYGYSKDMKIQFCLRSTIISMNSYKLKFCFNL